MPAKMAPHVASYENLVHVQNSKKMSTNIFNTVHCAKDDQKT